MMGIHANIDRDKFPKQGGFLNKRVRVCFHYNIDKVQYGRVVRDDSEAPGIGIIVLDDGRFVLTTECQYSVLVGSKQEKP